MAIHGLKNIALAVSLLVIGGASLAQPVPPAAPKLPTRPAPVSGKVAIDPAAVALHPAPAVPAVATSTARQVAPPANPNEPLLKPEAEPSSTQHATPHTAPPAPSAAQGKPHLDRTEGKKMPETTKGSKKVGKTPGHVHADKAGAGQRKKKGSKGKAEKVAQAETEQPHGVTAKRGKTHKAHAQDVAQAASKGHVAKGKAAKSHRTAHEAKAVASAPTVSTARELKADAHVKHKPKTGAHKVAAHHAKAASQVASKPAAKHAGKPKKKTVPAHAPA
jgi:hypothetical protein